MACFAPKNNAYCLPNVNAFLDTAFINSFDKPNFCFDVSHRRSTTVSLETRNPILNKLSEPVGG